MPSDDWYRNEVWNNEIKQRFLDKLSRARSQRDQYLKIQILCLSKSSPQDALELCHLYEETKKGRTWDLDVKASEARAHEALGEISDAIATYRKLFQDEINDSFFPSYALLEAPLMIALKGKQADFEFAWEVIRLAQNEVSAQGIRLPTQTFLLQAAQALLLIRSGQVADATKKARAALQAAGVSDSGLRYHRNVGLVGPEYRDTILELKSITSKKPKWLLKLVARYDDLASGFKPQ